MRLAILFLLSTVSCFAQWRTPDDFTNPMDGKSLQWFNEHFERKNVSGILRIAPDKSREKNVISIDSQEVGVKFPKMKYITIPMCELREPLTYPSDGRTEGARIEKWGKRTDDSLSFFVKPFLDHERVIFWSCIGWAPKEKKP